MQKSQKTHHSSSRFSTGSKSKKKPTTKSFSTIKTPTNNPLRNPNKRKFSKINVPGQTPFEGELSASERDEIVTKLHDQPLLIESFSPTPLPQFLSWFHDVATVEPIMPERMTLSTIKSFKTKKGHFEKDSKFGENNSNSEEKTLYIPSSRPVLLKEIIVASEMISPYSLVPPKQNIPILSTEYYFPTSPPSSLLSPPEAPTNSLPFPPAQLPTLYQSGGGFSFVSNYLSHKATQIEDGFETCSLTFHWVELERVVRVEGMIYKAPSALSDLYHNLRPRQSRLSALTSKQSSVIEKREILQKRYDYFDALLKSENYEQLQHELKWDKKIIRPEGVSVDEFVPRPDTWGGYVVIPHEIEFWQGRPSRIHERILYQRKDELGEDGLFKWDMEYLEP
jgi:pyridoxamine 5'-phosphate oxidase